MRKEPTIVGYIQLTRQDYYKVNKKECVISIQREFTHPVSINLRKTKD